MRLIDADEPLKALKTMTKSLANHQRSDFLEGFYNGCLAATFDIEDTPTVDAVEVVRCKDCEFWQDNNNGYPSEYCIWGRDETPDPDDFCSYGERKDDAEIH